MNIVDSLNPLAGDLDAIASNPNCGWEALRGETLFITGGTGFVGCWLLESFLWANDTLSLGARAVVLSRDPISFRRRIPHLACHPAIELVRGDVRDFETGQRTCRYVIYAAAEVRSASDPAQARETVETTLRGTRRTLEFAKTVGAEKVLFVSSGAVYDAGSEMREGSGWEHPAGTPYGEAKRLAESLCLSWSLRTGIEVKIARGFSFVGPYLPVGAGFAAASFIGDALAGGPVCANRRGSYRSYMYAGDMATWLWTILARGLPRRPYNVGSSGRVSTVDLALEIAEAAGVGVRFRDDPPGARSLAPTEYVPNIDRARRELGLAETVGLRESIRRTLSWHLARNIYRGSPPRGGEPRFESALKSDELLGLAGLSPAGRGVTKVDLDGTNHPRARANARAEAVTTT